MPSSCVRKLLPQAALQALLAVCLIAGVRLSAQTSQKSSDQPLDTAPAVSSAAKQQDNLAIFPHSDGARYFIAGQANIVFQAHAPFHSPYDGPNSMLSRGEYKTSLVGTLFLGYELAAESRTAISTSSIDVESAGGRGISEALGLAGFTNLDVVRNPTLGPRPYLARVQLHQTHWPLRQTDRGRPRRHSPSPPQSPSAASNSASAR